MSLCRFTGPYMVFHTNPDRLRDQKNVVPTRHDVGANASANRPLL